MNFIAKSAGNTDSNIAFWTEAVGGSPTEKLRITSGGNLLVHKTSTSDYGKFEVKGGTADNIETADITAKTIATFSGSTPGTTAAGKGAGIVIKPIADRGCNYFIGVANDGTNQEAHGRFIIRSGNFAGTTIERFRITSGGSVRVGDNSSFSAHTAADDLVVGATSGSNGMTILTGSATGNIFFNDGSGNDGVVQYVHSSSPNYMRIASSGHIRFDAAAISISDDNVAPTAGDLASGASFGIPRLHMRGDNAQSGAYELMARFQSGTDANDSGATIVLNHSNDRGLALQGGRGQSNRSFGAIKSIDNLGRLSRCIEYVGGNGAGVNRLQFFTGESATTTERLRITSDGRFGFNTTPTVANEYLHIKPVGNNVLDLRYELNSDTDIRHKFYDNAGVWRGGFNYTTYANSSAYPNFHDSYYFLTDPGSNGTLATALRITREGQFIKPLTYQFLVETAGVSVSGGWTKLTGMSIDSTHSTGVSNGTYWSNSNQRFTAPVTGTYNFFIGGFSSTAEGGGTNHRYMYVFVINGGNYKYGIGGNYSDGNTPMEGGSINYKLSVNDYVEVYYYTAISATWGNSSHRFYWGGYFLG